MRAARISVVLLAAAALTLVVGASAQPVGDSGPREHTLTYRRISVGEYQNFLVNWDDRKHPVLYALVDTPARYAALFHPAPVNFSMRHFAPETKVFAGEEILVVGRVMAAPGDMNKVFDVERVTGTGQELTLRYRFRDPGSKASYTVKDYLAVRIPKHDYKRIVFVENGKRIGDLAPSEGRWSVPEVAPGPDAKQR